MVLLDTDHMSLFQRGGGEGQRIRRRLQSLPPDEVSTTIISYEEQMRGWLSQVAHASSAQAQEVVYAELKCLLNNYCVIAVADYNAKSIAAFEELRRQRVRIGTMDLKIAAIALANDATLLTRNLSQFHKVPGLRAEDWSV